MTATIKGLPYFTQMSIKDTNITINGNRYESIIYKRKNLFDAGSSYQNKNIVIGFYLANSYPGLTIGYDFKSIASVFIFPTFSIGDESIYPGIQFNVKIIKNLNLTYSGYLENFVHDEIDLVTLGDKNSSGVYFKKAFVNDLELGYMVTDNVLFKNINYIIEPGLSYAATRQVFGFEINIKLLWGK